MLQLFDDEISRVFFAERIVVVEGDTELLAIKNTLKIIPEATRKEILYKSLVACSLFKVCGNADIVKDVCNSITHDEIPRNDKQSSALMKICFKRT